MWFAAPKMCWQAPFNGGLASEGQRDLIHRRPSPRQISTYSLASSGTALRARTSAALVTA